MFCRISKYHILSNFELAMIWGCSKGRLTLSTLQCFCNNIVFVLVKQQIRVATQVKRRVRAVNFVKNNLSTATLETQPEFTTNRNSPQYFNNNYWITLKKKKVKLLNMDWSGKVKISDFWLKKSKVKKMFRCRCRLLTSSWQTRWKQMFGKNESFYENLHRKIVNQESWQDVVDDWDFLQGSGRWGGWKTFLWNHYPLLATSKQYEYENNMTQNLTWKGWCKMRQW